MSPSTLTRPRALLRALAAAFVLVGSGLAAGPAHASSADVNRIDDAAFVVTVAKDGGVHVEATLDVTYAEPEDLPSLWWRVPTRVPLEDDDSGGTSADDEPVAVQTLSHLTSTARLGDDAATTRSLPVDADSLGGVDYLDVTWPDFLDAPVSSARFTLSYDVAGAVLAQGGSPAALALGLVDGSATLPLDRASVRVVGPRGPVSGLTCATATSGVVYYDYRDTTCTPDDGGVRATIGGDHGLVVGAPEVPGATGQEPTLASRWDDTIDSFDADYTVGADGSLDVTETIVYRFGVDANQHGIIRSLVSREPWSTWRDRTYGVDVLGVTSPSGADATVHRSTTGAERLRTTDLRIGSKDERVRTPTATYVLRYRVDGALLQRDGHDELSWDVTGNMSSALHRAVDVTVHLPADATAARCWAGEPGSTDPCEDATSSGRTATFHAADLDGGAGLTIDVTMPTGSVAATGPDLAFRAAPEWLGVYLRLLVGGGALGLVVSVVVAVAYRLTHRDARDRGVAVPAGPRSTPPDLPLPVAGTIVDGVMSSRETTGVLLALAAAGVVAFEPRGDSFGLRVARPRAGRDRFERAVVAALEKRVAQVETDDAPDEDDRPPLTGTALRVALQDAHAALRKAVRTDLDERQKTPESALFRRKVRMRTGDPVRWPWTLFALPVPGLFPVVVVVRFVHGLRPTDRSALGARHVDETRAFRRHLTELGESRAPSSAAAPVRYASDDGAVPGMLSGGGPGLGSVPRAGGRSHAYDTGLDPLATQDDLFGTLLPWAAALGVADDWYERLGVLVRDGVLTAPDGLALSAGRHDLWSGYWIAHTTASAAVWTSSSGGSSGTGYSGGSSYSGGGGFSGGGGGGGGTSSW
ncbi:DUF2207 domain-containing protein [Luteimicrobium sp. DT211]|uniref:DUF2207 domain-containing protein n=1 Tax=Luteimicrobium sp. DT211 TaxID=3393412 RepID=UPI003CF39800